MKNASQWILVFKVCLSLMIALSCSRSLSAAQNNEPPNTVLANDNSGYISIDCGIQEDYIDSNTSLSYKSDSSFISTGENHVLSNDYISEDVYFGKQLKSLRSFSNGKKNCYTLKPKEGKNNHYHITALFQYGNYDSSSKAPTFDVHLGVNYWQTIQTYDDPRVPNVADAIYFATSDTIDVCLVNIDKGTPFISSLELRPLRDPIPIYRTASYSEPVDLIQRTNLGMFEHDDDYVRYRDDIYSRVWYVSSTDDNNGNNATNTSIAFSVDGMNDAFKLPSEVLGSAVRAFNLSTSCDVEAYGDKSYEYIVYLHFFEFEEQATQYQKKRIMKISFNDESILTEPLTLHYWKPVTIVHKFNFDDNDESGRIRISIASTSDSHFPAMLNAYEIYRVLPQPNQKTAQQDVEAMWDIKSTYKISKITWQGDPCVPKELAWDGLTCSYDNTPRVTSLNLSSSNLKGEISDSFFNLTKLETLDLSSNELTGDVPEFLGDLTELHNLNLAGNKLTGSIPWTLKEKLKTPNFMLSLGENSVCQKDSCTSRILLAAIIAGFVAFLIITVVIIFSLMIWRLRRKKQATRKEEQLKSKNRVFSYAEILSITQNLKTVIGKGGFGNVYLGALQDSTQVAVKLLSNSSMQGYKEFQSEAQLLMIVHHRNLVRLVGFCDEGDIKALVYEYMTMGNLQQRLSDKSLNVLKWKQRLQIALDAAHGLDYLHNGCKPPIVHRDLKPSNILLNEDMQPKIADFGLSRAFAEDIDTHISTRPAGTLGYLDPEFHSTGNLNKKSDIYSFGIILLELVTGQPAIIGTSSGEIDHILNWVNHKLQSGDIQSIVDPRLQDMFNPISVWKFVKIAMSCTQSTAIQRPDIAQIISELRECLALEIAIESAECSSQTTSSSSDMCVLQLEWKSGPHESRR